MKQNQLNPQVYYVRECEAGVPKRGQPPLGCVAIGKTEDGKFCRGISIRSMSDNWSYAIGRKLATARLRHAMGCKQGTAPIGEASYLSGLPLPTPMPAANRFKRTWADNFGAEFAPDLKSGYDVTPTPYELDLVRVRDEKAQGGGEDGTKDCCSGRACCCRSRSCSCHA